MRGRSGSEQATPSAKDETRPHRASLIRSLGYFVPSYALAIVGYLGLNVLAARMLKSEFSYYVVLLTVTTLIGQFSLLGVHRAGLREAARASDTETLRNLRRGFRAVLSIPLPITSVLTGAVVLAWGGVDPSSLAVAALTAVLVYESGYGIVTTSFLRGLGHLRAASLLAGRSGGAIVAVAQIGCLLPVYVLAPDSGLPGVLAGTVVGYALPLAWVWWLLHRSWPHARGPTSLVHDLRNVWRRDWKFTFSQSGGFLNSTVELWLGAAMLAAGDASLFAAAQRMGRLLVIPATSLQIVFSPAISRLAHAEGRKQLEMLVRTASTITTVVSGVLWLPMVVAPHLLLTLVFGDLFSAAALALVLISTGYLLNSVSGMSGTTLSMTHHEGDTALITWSVVALRVVAGVIAVWFAGVAGLAASSAITSVLYYAATWTAVRRRLGISTHATLRPHLSMLRRIAG